MASTATAKAHAVSRAVEGLRRMIVTGELLPGQHIGQEAMAQTLQVSRLPVREALRQLAADGLVDHTPNQGYQVARLSRAEFDEIYLMRRLLETELIRTLAPASVEDITAISRLNDLVVEAAERDEIAAMQRHNHDFHFAIFNLSELKLVVEEVERFWTWASPYHAVYLFSAESRRIVLEEHALMIDALRVGDHELLAQTMDRHRQGSESHLSRAVALATDQSPSRPA